MEKKKGRVVLIVFMLRSLDTATHIEMITPIEVAKVLLYPNRKIYSRQTPHVLLHSLHLAPASVYGSPRISSSDTRRRRTPACTRSGGSLAGILNTSRCAGTVPAHQNRNTGRTKVAYATKAILG